MSDNVPTPVSNAKDSAFVRFLQVALICGTVAYFCGVLVWFSALFATGGTEEHGVMSVVIPVFGAVGVVAAITMTSILSEGFRADREASKD